MAIRPLDDLGGPAFVALADIITSEKKPSWNRPLGIAMCAGGYILGGVMNVGGNFLKQMGVGSFDWAAGSLYAYTKETTPTRVTRNATRVPISKSIGRYPAPAYDEGFENVRLV